MKRRQICFSTLFILLILKGSISWSMVSIVSYGDGCCSAESACVSVVDSSTEDKDSEPTEDRGCCENSQCHCPCCTPNTVAPSMEQQASEVLQFLPAKPVSQELFHTAKWTYSCWHPPQV